MSMGMPYNDYWYGKPEIVKYYRDLHIYRQREFNENAWLQGAYNYNAFSAALENVMYSFSKKGSKPKGYIQKAFDLGISTEYEKDELERREREKAIKSLLNWEKAWKQRYGNS